MNLPVAEEWTSPILIALLVILLIYWYVRPSNSYWAEQGIPFVPAKLLVGSLNLFSKKYPHEVDLENYKKYGRMYGIYEGSRPYLILSRPDLLKNVLVKDFSAFPGRRTLHTGIPIADNMLSVIIGEKWKRIRSIVSPAFATGKIKRMTDIILSSAKTLVQNFAENVGKPINGKELFGTFTMDVIASAAFATKIHSHQDPNNRFIQAGKKFFSQDFSWRLLLFVLFPRVQKFFRINIFAPGVIEFFKEAATEIIRDRRETGKTGNDFLQLLIDAEKEAREQEIDKAPGKSSQTVDDKNSDEFNHDRNNAPTVKTPSKTKILSEDEMIAQCVIFFLAGFDTTASTLTFAAYNLAINPKIQDKLIDEIDTVIRNHDGKLTYEATQDMKYMDQVFAETLRMYPPAIRIERVADVDYELAATGVTVKKDTVVVAPVYAIHHDPKFYPEPEKFNPDRFTADEKSLRDPYTYMPFGAGPRNCVARRFALMEIKLCLAYMLSQLRIKQCPETQVPLVLTSNVTMSAKDVTFSVEKRENRVFDGL